MKLEQRIKELEKRIALLESQRPVITVYPYQQPVQPYQQPVQPYNPYYNQTTGGGTVTLIPPNPNTPRYPFYSNC